MIVIPGGDRILFDYSYNQIILFFIELALLSIFSCLYQPVTLNFSYTVTRTLLRETGLYYYNESLVHTRVLLEMQFHTFI